MRLSYVLLCLAAMAMPPLLNAELAVGSAAPDISFTQTWNDDTGSVNSLHDLLGSYILIYHWDDK